MSDGALRFFPWLRRGLAAGVQSPSTGADARPSVKVSLAVLRDAERETLSPTLRLYGPGDVVQLDPAQVIAIDPKPRVTDFEPNLLATVVFDAPELPWLFSPDATPEATQAGGRVRPWLCLVVVRREAAELHVEPQLPLPRLVLADAHGELPDLAESWAWAHAQLAGTAAGWAGALAGPPSHTLARLVCPRRLRARTAYLACVVPVFAAGRQAGLAEPVRPGTELAWTSPAAGRVVLPVYYHWEFATGPAGDFEALARRLEGRPLPAAVGLRPFDLTRAGSGLPVLRPGAPGATLGLEGALRSPAALPTPWPDPPCGAFQERLEAALGAAPGEEETVVVPPVYGAAQAGVEGVDGAPAWLRELNLDPRHRAAAAFGAEVVQDQQEQLMASAWDQAGELLRANQRLREAQLARAVGRSVRERRMEQFAPAVALRVAEPASPRVAAPPSSPAAGSASLLGAIRVSAFPEAAVSPTFRRALRPLGPLGRRIGSEAPATLMSRFAAGSARVPIADTLGGTVELDRVGAPKLRQVTDEIETASGWRRVDDFAAAPGLAPAVASSAPGVTARSAPAAPSSAQPAPAARPQMAARAQRLIDRDRIDDGDLPGDVDETLPRRRRRLGRINSRFRSSSAMLQAHVTQPVVTPAPAGQPLPVDAIVPELVEAGGRLDPEETVPAVAGAAVSGPRLGTDPLAPVAVTPSFPQPMSAPLRSLSEQLILPGAEHVPDDTVSVLEANPRFIEAYMVGLSDELGRECRWRGLPADPRTTFFRQFWDVRGRDAQAAGRFTDIPPVDTWSTKGGLGSHATRVGGRDMLVLVIRGSLVRRYPTLTLYAVKAADGSTLGAEERYPEFRMLLDPDLLLAGFGLSVAEARGGAPDPGWFFVVQEQVVEPRFGFDEPDSEEPQSFGGVPAGWQDMTWGHVVADKAAYDRLGHVRLAEVNPALANLTLEGATWGLDAAHMAQVTLQAPVRVAVHAQRMLPTRLDAAPHPITAVRRDGDRVAAVGGVDRFGEPWRLEAPDAIASIIAGARAYVVEVPQGGAVPVVVGEGPGGESVLTTPSDGGLANALLDLPALEP